MAEPISYQRDSLAEIAFKKAEELGRAEDRAESLRGALERFDEALAAMEWVVSREIDKGNRTMDTAKLLRVLGEVSAYGDIGIRPWWLPATLANMREGGG